MSDVKRVFQTGTFDVQNYGDLLFPLIADFRLGQSRIEIVPISPTGFETGWEETVASRPFAALLDRREKIDGLLIGGGNIVHTNPANLRDYEIGTLPARAYAQLWFGATLAAALRNVPVAWNAPGVPTTKPLGAKAVATLALQAADYLSVRDEASAGFLGEAFAAGSIVPDTAVDIARMWPRRTLVPAFKNLIERKGAPADAKFVAVHVKERSLDCDHAAFAAALTQFAVTHGLTPLLIAIGPCHDDQSPVRRIARNLRIAHLLLDEPIGLREIAAAIAHASLYLGASLHGYITSAAYDVPGVIVAKPPLVKHTGFLSHTGRPEDLATGWDDAFTRGASRLAEPAARRLPEALFRRLDTHWDRIRSVILEPMSKSAERTRFLRRYIESGTKSLGDAWLLEPLLRK